MKIRIEGPNSQRASEIGVETKTNPLPINLTPKFCRRRAATLTCQLFGLPAYFFVEASYRIPLHLFEQLLRDRFRCTGTSRAFHKWAVHPDLHADYSIRRPALLFFEYLQSIKNALPTASIFSRYHLSGGRWALRSELPNSAQRLRPTADEGQIGVSVSASRELL